jgi:glycosyltransferase involved in cell wall biosynthesis
MTQIPRLRREVDSSYKEGYSNYIVCPGNSKIEVNARYVGIREPRGRFDRYGKLSKEIFQAALKTDADIYQIHDPNFLRYARKLKRLGKKVIFDSHEHYLTRIKDLPWIPSCFKGILSFAFKEYVRYCLKHVDAVLGVNKEIVQSLEKYSKECILVMNFPALREVKGNVTKYDGFNICYTGAITDQYSIIELMCVFEKTENVNVIMCGRADEDYMASLEKEAYWKRVKHLGIVPPNEAIEVQEKSNVGIVILKPSNNTNGKYGTMGNTKLFEYMMSGIPVICTDFACWKEIVDKYNCGICVDPYDIEAISNAIIRLRDNPELALHMGRNARRAAEEIYNWNSQGIRLIELYGRL